MCCCVALLVLCARAELWCGVVWCGVVWCCTRHSINLPRTQSRSSDDMSVDSCSDSDSSFHELDPGVVYTHPSPVHLGASTPYQTNGRHNTVFGTTRGGIVSGVRAITSGAGENLFIGSNFVARGCVDQWVMAIEERMRRALKFQLDLTLDRLCNLPVAMWVDSAGTELVMQTVVTAAELRWSALIDQAVAFAHVVATQRADAAAAAAAATASTTQTDGSVGPGGVASTPKTSTPADAGASTATAAAAAAAPPLEVDRDMVFQEVMAFCLSSIRDLTRRVLQHRGAHRGGATQSHTRTRAHTRGAQAVPGAAHLAPGSPLMRGRRRQRGSAGMGMMGMGMMGMGSAGAASNVRARRGGGVALLPGAQRGSLSATRRRRHDTKRSSALMSFLSLQEMSRLGVLPPTPRASDNQGKGGTNPSGGAPRHGATGSGSGRGRGSGGGGDARATMDATKPASQQRVRLPRVDMSQVAQRLRLLTTSSLLTALVHARDVTLHLEASLLSGQDPRESEWFTLHPRLIRGPVAGETGGIGGVGSTDVRVLMGSVPSPAAVKASGSGGNNSVPAVPYQCVS